jgi:hypothetical protein
MKNTYNVEFVFERMVIITTVEAEESIIADESATNFYQKPTDESIIELAKDSLISYYKIDPEVMYLQDVIVHEVD